MKDPGRGSSIGTSLMGLFALASALWLGAGCGEAVDPRPEVVEPNRPIGAAEYDRRLSEAAGQPMTGAELVDIAAAEVERLEAEMDRIAAEIDPGATGRKEVLARLRSDHPETPEEVLETYREEIERAEQAVREWDLVDLPESPVTVTEILNPVFQRYFSLAMYLDGKLAVTVRPASQPGSEAEADDGTYLQNHCRVCIPPLAVHEIYPGHHVAFERVALEIEDPAERTAINRRQVFFHEGWGLYAEFLMWEQGYYEGQPDRLLGALSLLHLRALRAWIDPLLHAGEMTEEQALERYRERALLTSDAARAEVERHLKDPVMKASYFVGLRQILDLRERWRRRAPEAPLKEFHQAFLGRPAPIPQVAEIRFDESLAEGPPITEPP